MEEGGLFVPCKSGGSLAPWGAPLQGQTLKYLCLSLWLDRELRRADPSRGSKEGFQGPAHKRLFPPL